MIWEFRMILMSSLTSTTSTVSTVIGPPQKKSWLTMAPCKWPQPELSIGVAYGTLDPLGRYNCWSVREKSPAHLAWKPLSKSIWNLLQAEFEHLDARGSVLHVEIFMVGKKIAKSNPTVLFCSDNKTLRRRAMELVEKKGIMTISTGILAAHSSRLPRLLAAGDMHQLSNLPEGVYAFGQIRSCGVSIYIIRKGSPPRRATIGGFVLIQDEFYGLTTAHAFSETTSTATKAEAELELSFSGLGFPDDSSDDDGEDDMLEITSKGGNPAVL